MKKIINSIILTFIILTNFLCHAQVDLDSLRKVWNDKSAPETTRALALFDLTWYGYMYSQPDSALFFAQMMYDFASKRGLKKEMAMAKSAQGIAAHVKSNYTQAIDYHQKSFSLYEEISDSIGMAGCLNNIGIIYREKGYSIKALNNYERILKIIEELPNQHSMPHVYLNIGVIYHTRGDYSKAMDIIKSFIISRKNCQTQEKWLVPL